MIPSWLFSAMLWLALIAVGVGLTYLIIALIADWRRDELW